MSVIKGVLCGESRLFHRKTLATLMYKHARCLKLNGLPELTGLGLSTSKEA